MADSAHHPMTPRCAAVNLVLGLMFATACANTVDGSRWAGDAGRRDVPPGLNPDGDDPFRPTDAGVIQVDGSVDRPTWELPDGAVFDQRYAYLWVGAYLQEGVETGLAQAEFRYIPRPEETRCTYVSASNWDIVTCTDGEAPNDPHPRPFPHAGNLTITGGTVPVTLRPGTSGQYTSFFEMEPVFHGPRTVTLSAPGTSTVPRLSLTARVPDAIALTTPAAGAPVALARNQDLRVAWRPIEARSVYVSVTAQGTLDGRRVSVRVISEFTGGAPDGVIPRRALQPLFALTAVSEVSLFAAPQNLTTTMVGSWPVQVTTQGLGIEMPVTLQ